MSEQYSNTTVCYTKTLIIYACFVSILLKLNNILLTLNLLNITCGFFKFFKVMFVRDLAEAVSGFVILVPLKVLSKNLCVGWKSMA